jgi:hypothetical protein
MFGRRRDIQIPKVPVSGDKATQSWMTAVGSMLSKYIGGGSNDRLVSASELIDAGLAGSGTGGFLTLPPKNLTKPPKVTGLTANGALASIFVGWHNPSFSNYAYTELWRSNLDDIGQAVLIASTAVESYTDNVGSAATKYYWARAVSDQGVKGDFNAASGVKGTTSLDPDYVMQVLTSSTWKANTTYYPFQYVRPTVENGFQYAAVDGGKSGNIEPTWPLSVDPTIVTNDGTVQWKCLHIEDRIPFVLGTLEDGTPAVFMDTAYIMDATITSAKIIDLVADKIETGNLIADLQVKSKLWYGFNQPNGDFLDPEDNTVTSGKTGFYLGVNGSGSLPVLHLNTGVANGSRSLYFDGVQLKIENVDLVSSSDGEFDDLKGDSVNFNRANFDFLAFGEQVTASQYTADNDISIGDPEFEQYLCYPNGCQKTEFWKSSNLILGTGFSRPYAFFQTGNYTAIKPYDYRSSATRYRANKQNIAFSILIDAPNAAYVNNNYGGTYLTVYVLSESQYLSSANYNSAGVTDGVPSKYLLKIPVNNHANGTVTAYQNTGSGDVAAFHMDVVYDTQTNTGQIMLKCDNDLGLLGYKGARTLKVAVVYKMFYQAGGSDDTTFTGEIKVYMQLRSIVGELTVPENDNTLGITATAGNQQQIATFTQAQLKTINELIAWWNRPAPL